MDISFKICYYKYIKKKGEKRMENINPYDLEDIKNAMKLEEPLWFFLDDSVPDDGKDINIIIKKEGDEFTYNEYTTMITDLLYFNCDNKDAIEELNLDYMIPYIPFLKSVYHPYFLEITPEPKNKNEEKLLKKLQKSGICIGTQNKINDDQITANLKFMCGNINIEKTIYLDER